MSAGRGSRIAIAEALAADTVTAAATTGSTTSQIALVSGAASFEIGDIANLTGSGATVANNKRVVEVTAVDASLQTIDFYPAMSIAPAATDEIRKGWREWVRAPGAAPLDQYIYSGELYGEHPAMQLLRDDPAPEVIGVLVPISTQQLVAALDEEPIRLRILSAGFVEWAEGAEQRATQLLNATPSALTARGETCYALRFGVSTRPQRDDELIERVLPMTPEMAPTFA